MKRFAAALLLLMPLAAPAFADDQPPPSLTATGEGTEMVVPDIARVTLGVVSRAETAAAALAQNSADMEKVIAAVKAAGIAEKDISTTGFSVGPVYPPPRPDGDVEQRIVGYEVSNEVHVTIRDLKNSGTILDQVVGSGANRVYGITFDNADRQGPLDKALTAAIANAKKKAELMAAAAGVKLGRVLSVNAGEGSPPMPYRGTADMAMAKAVPVMAGERAVTATATVTWEIAQ